MEESIDPAFFFSLKNEGGFVCWLNSSGEEGNINEQSGDWNAARALLDLIAFEFFDFLH